MSRRLLVLAIVTGGLTVVGAAAWAHPFGPPPTARLLAQGPTLTVMWSATPDDAVAIGEDLGVMPPGSVEAYRVESAAQVAPSAVDEARLAASSELRDYLLEHIVVHQGNARCSGEVTSSEDFVHTGATVVLTCPDTVREVTMRISMLHALHPAYRTVAIAPEGQPSQAVFTVEDPEQRWRFGAEAAGEDSPSVAMLALGGAMLAAAGVLLWMQRRQRPR